MDVDHPERDQRWNDRARSETENERLDRNWSSLLQELRVTQTGCDNSVRWQRYYEVVRLGWDRALTSLKALLET